MVAAVKVELRLAGLEDGEKKKKKSREDEIWERYVVPAIADVPAQAAGRSSEHQKSCLVSEASASELLAACTARLAEKDL